MTKQDIQKHIKDAVLDTDIYDQVIVADIQLNRFADEPTTIQVEIQIIDIETWIGQSGLLINEIDQFDPEKGHYQITEITPIEDFDISNDIIREYIRTNDTFTII